jgi:hypothetical protein
MPHTHASSNPEQRDIFLSHRTTDKDSVLRLAADIESAQARGRPLMTWVDVAEIRPGQSIPAKVNEELETSRFVALVMTPAYFESPSGWTGAEWHSVLHVDPDNRRARIIPILAADCPYIPYLLKHLNAIDFRGNRYPKALEELLRILRDEPLPRPVALRGQLVQPGSRIDRSTLMAERAVPEGDPDAVPEKLYCNLLPIESLPRYVYVAPIAPGLRKPKAKGGDSLPTKQEIKDLVLARQREEGVERPFVPAFRLIQDQLVTFHDLESPECPLSGAVDADELDPVRTEDYLRDDDQRTIVTSLLNMGIARHLHGRGLVVDQTRLNRFFFPPKDGQPRVIEWRPLKRKAPRTVAKPYLRDGEIKFWIHQAASIHAVFIANRYYVHLRPTWVLTQDGFRVKGGPEVGRVVVKWTGQERNIHVLYHVRFWATILRRQPGPIMIRVGDQWMEVAMVPAFVQQAYGVGDDHMDLMGLLDQEAQILGELEDEVIEVREPDEDDEESEGQAGDAWPEEAIEEALDELDQA